MRKGALLSEERNVRAQPEGHRSHRACQHGLPGTWDTGAVLAFYFLAPFML